ncbi:purine permease [Salinisphaera sp. USBA-960]|nr:purine permease [Salifodinibacter halophilus]NNC26516.1 purine permease [Salifodinibacter halophilus]
MSIRGNKRNQADTQNARTASPRPEDHRQPPFLTLAYGFQHVLTMYAGLVAVPLIVGQAANLSDANTAFLITAAFFMGGLITLLQTLGLPFIGSQLPLMQGVSFDTVAIMTAIVSATGGLQAVFGAVLVASIFGFLFAPVISKALRFFPPVVTGSLITVIGLSLLPVTINWTMGGDSTAADYGSLSNIGLGAITLAIGLVLSKFKSGVISRLAILLAIVAGTVIALPLGKADFSGVASSTVFAFPTPLHFGMPTFHLSAIVSMIIGILVILTETTADILALREIVGTKVDNKRFTAGLRADMASGIIAPFFGSFPQSAFAQNIGLVAVTGVKSRFVVATAGGILVILGLFPILGRIVTAIPSAVLGGAGFLLFGSVAASGIRMLADVDYRHNMNLIIVAVTISVGIIPAAAPDFYAQFPSWFQTIASSGISSAAIVAVSLNILFNHIHLGTPEEPSVFAAAGTGRQLSPGVSAALKHGDHVINGQVIDAKGNEVPVVQHNSHPS